MLYTLFLCFLILVVREKVKQKGLCFLLCVVLLLLTGIGDWPYYAALFVMMFDFWWGNWAKLKNAYVIAVLSFGALMLLNYRNTYPLWQALAFSKWFFYIFYPAHLLLLWAARETFNRTFVRFP